MRLSLSMCARVCGRIFFPLYLPMHDGVKKSTFISYSMPTILENEWEFQVELVIMRRGKWISLFIMVHKILFASFSTHSDIDAANITRQEIKKTEQNARVCVCVCPPFECISRMRNEHIDSFKHKRINERTSEPYHNNKIKVAFSNREIIYLLFDDFVKLLLWSSLRL